jgi:hypothetical protein
MRIAFRKQNTTQNIAKQHPQTNKYNESGLYQMKCSDGLLKYEKQRAEGSASDAKDIASNQKQ